MPVLMSKPQYTFRKSVDFDYTPGKHFIRFLQPFETFSVLNIHWINSQKAMVQCLGSDCPICQNNKLIYSENPGKKGQELIELGYIRKNQYAYANILDRTEVKVCPNAECQREVTKDFTDRYPAVCPQCNTVIAGVTPVISNKVKVIRLNQTVVDLMNAKETSKLDAEGNPISPTSYDWEFLVLPGDKKETAPDTHLERNDPVSVPVESLYDLSEKVTKFTAEELREILRGTKVRDIYAVRKAITSPSSSQPQPGAVLKTELTDEQKEAQKQRINELFKD